MKKCVISINFEMRKIKNISSKFFCLFTWSILSVEWCFSARLGYKFNFSPASIDRYVPNVSKTEILLPEFKKEEKFAFPHLKIVRERSANGGAVLSPSGR